MKSLPALVIWALLPLCQAEEKNVHPAVTAFQDMVKAVEAKDDEKAKRFFAAHQVEALSKLFEGEKPWVGLADLAEEVEIISYKGTEKNGELVFAPQSSGFPLPVRVHQKRWVLDAQALSEQMAEFGRELQAEARLQRVKAALDVYRLLAGTYPTVKQGLVALVTIPDPKPRRWQQAFKEIPKDPWGRMIQYSLVDGTPQLRSLGPDGVVSRDDIVLP